MSNLPKKVPGPRPSARSVRTRTAARLPPREARAAARTIALRAEDAASVAAIVAALPNPGELPPGTLVVVPAEVASPPSLARAVLSVFGRTKTVRRSLRCSALVARGYVDVGAADDDATDIAWGYARPRADATDEPG